MKAKKLKSFSGAEITKLMQQSSKPLTICPACGKRIEDLQDKQPHHRWNGNMFDSRLVCPNNPQGKKAGEEFKQI